MAEDRWSYTVGERPHRVTVTERGGAGGMLQVRVWDAKHGRMIRRSLGHRDQARAKRYAAKMHAKLIAGERDLREGRVSLSRLFSLYREAVTPGKVRSEQKADDRRIEMWLRVLGANTDSHAITSRAWRGFLRDRASGAIDARGKSKPEGKRRPVRPRTVEADCVWLRQVLGWGTRERTKGGRLLRENCVEGYAVPHEENPRRPVASRDRFEAIRAETDNVTMEIRWEGKCVTDRSWLSEVFDLAMATGRRIGAVCQLRSDDLELGRGPFGFVRWRADADKEKRETFTPIDHEARSAIDRQLQRRPIIGKAHLFPSPTNPDRPMSRHLADKWLRQAEELAGVEPQDGSLWHAYRRGWATARKDLPSADVAKLGGWSGPRTLEQVYQQADMGTMLEIVTGRHELREVR